MNDLQRLIVGLCRELFGVPSSPVFTCPDERFGDYATNIALQLAGQLGEKPAVVASQLVERLQQASPDVIREVSVAGPGFINIRLTDAALWQLQQAPPTASLQGQSVVVEYSDPNPFKTLHAGHLYTTVVGDVISNLLERAGAQVHRTNFGGDVGLHVGKSLWGIVQFLGGELPQKLNEVPTDSRLEWLSERYVEGNTAYETDDQAKATIVELNKRVYQIHADNDHQSALAQLYWTCRQWSYEGFNQLYEQLHVTPFEKFYPESETTPKGMELVQTGLQKNVFETSDGAVVLRGEEQGLHTRVFVNSAGLPTYETKDLGLAAHKWQDYHPDKNLIITGNDIVEYMKVVLAAVRAFYPEMADRTTHLTHGMVKLTGGVKMSSRKGNTLRAVDILEAAAAASQQLLGKAEPDSVLAAVKYAFLKNRVGGDIIYSPEESVALEGNSGPYLQYAHARACSILAKASGEQPAGDGELDPAERTLLRKLSQYPEVVEVAIAELMPHHICTYLYELAQTFNRFYEANRVLGDTREATRLKLLSAYAATLKDGLTILGIAAPDHV